MAWKEYELGELLEYEQPTAYIVQSTKYDDKYPTPVLTAGKSFILGYTNETEGIFDKLPVIIFDDFTTATQYVNFKFKVKSSAMKILNVNTDLVLPKFIFYRMQIIDFDHSTHKRYWIQQYSRIKVSVPDSLDEQQRIVSQIEELFSDLDGGVATLEKTKKELDLYRQAAITNAYPAIDSSNKSTLDQVTDISGGITKGRHLSGDDVIKLPYLRVANVQNGFLDLSEMKEIELRADEKKKYLLKKGDVLYTEGGDRDKLGRGTVWNNELPECVHQNHVFKARIKNNRALPEYLAYWSMGGYARNYFYSKGKQTVNLASINKTVLSALPIPIVNVTEQKKIVDKIESRLSICDEIEHTIDTALQQSSSLRQSILKKAFEGELVHE